MGATTYDVRELLDERFEGLDAESKLVVALIGFAQCGYSHRRFLALGQLQSAREYMLTDQAITTAASVNPSIVDQITGIQALLPAVSMETDYQFADLAPKMDRAATREFLWDLSAYESPEWYEIRHLARQGLTAVERALQAQDGAPPVGEHG